MSKSKGNVVRPDELLQLRQRRGALLLPARNASRIGPQLLFRGIHGSIERRPGQRPGQPGVPHPEHAQRYRQGIVPAIQDLDPDDQDALQAGRALAPAYLAKAEANDFQGALDLLWAYLRQLDGYIVKSRTLEAGQGRPPARPSWTRCCASSTGRCGPLPC